MIREIGPWFEFNNDPAEVDGWAIRVWRVFIYKRSTQAVPRVAIWTHR